MIKWWRMFGQPRRFASNRCFFSPRFFFFLVVISFFIVLFVAILSSRTFPPIAVQKKAVHTHTCCTLTHYRFVACRQVTGYKIPNTATTLRFGSNAFGCSLVAEVTDVLCLRGRLKMMCAHRFQWRRQFWLHLSGHFRTGIQCLPRSWPLLFKLFIV